MVENRFIVAPDRVASIDPVRAIRGGRTYPDDFDVLGPLASAGQHAIPLVGYPGTGTVSRIVKSVGITCIPSGVPLHHQMIVGICRVTPDGTIKIFIDAVRKTREDARPIVVSILIKSSNSRGGGY